MTCEKADREAALMRQRYRIRENQLYNTSPIHCVLISSEFSVGTVLRASQRVVARALAKAASLLRGVT